MKIVQLVQKPQRRGAEVFAYQLSDTLRKKGHDVRTFYLYPYPGAKPLTLGHNDAMLQGQESHFLEKLPGFHPGLLGRVMAKIQSFRPDVVQVNGARTIKYGAFAKRYGSYKDWVIIYRNIDNPQYWVRDPLRRFFYKKLVMPRVDGVIGVSQLTLQNVKTLYELEAATTYIPNGVDPVPLLQPALSRAMARQKLETPTDGPVVLFMGNLTDQKRPDRFLRIMRKVYEKCPNVEAWILGDGPLRQSLQDESQRLGIDHIVRFWGYQEDIAPYIAASDLLLVTSDSDGIPAVILEASFLGKPTVATQVGGMSDCVLDGETGFLIDPRDEPALSEAVWHLLTEPTERTKMGEKAAKWAQSNFSIDIIAQRYFDFYLEVLARNSKETVGDRMSGGA